jgi:plasmid stabilization system protein ParE
MVHASTVVTKIIRVSRTLSRFPLAGRVVPEFEDQALRERFIYSYRIIYRVQGKTVTVAAVIHGRRMLEAVEPRLVGS